MEKVEEIEIPDELKEVLYFYAKRMQNMIDEDLSIETIDRTIILDLKRDVLRTALRVSCDNKTKAAKLLNLNRDLLSFFQKELGINEGRSLYQDVFGDVNIVQRHLKVIRFDDV